MVVVVIRCACSCIFNCCLRLLLLRWLAKTVRYLLAVSNVYLLYDIVVVVVAVI